MSCYCTIQLGYVTDKPQNKPKPLQPGYPMKRLRAGEVVVPDEEWHGAKSCARLCKGLVRKVHGEMLSLVRQSFAVDVGLCMAAFVADLAFAKPDIRIPGFAYD